MSWISIHDRLPPVHEIVLGWWADMAIATVVRESSGEWRTPGYRVSERRAVPLFWMPLPERPRVESPT